MAAIKKSYIKQNCIAKLKLIPATVQSLVHLKIFTLTNGFIYYIGDDKNL